MTVTLLLLCVVGGIVVLVMGGIITLIIALSEAK